MMVINQNQPLAFLVIIKYNKKAASYEAAFFIFN